MTSATSRGPPASPSSAAGSASGSSERPGRCSLRRAAGAFTATASAPPSRSSRPPTASRTCCSRCAWTRRASQRSRTTGSRARRGGGGAACRSGCAPRSTRRAGPRVARQAPGSAGCAAVAVDVVGGGHRRRPIRRALRRAPPRALRPGLRGARAARPPGRLARAGGRVVSVLSFREGRGSDLRATFEFGEAVWDESRKQRGLLPPDHRRDPEELSEAWSRERPLLEFIAAQPDGCYLICEDGDELVGYLRSARFGVMDELTELWVSPSHAGRGVGRALLERCWPESPTPELGRVVLELDAAEPAVHALTPERAVTEWKRLEPPAIGHERPALHEFFGRTRTCLAIMDGGRGEALALCWVSPDGEIGPAVAEEPQHLVPVVLAALDRVAKQQEPETFGVFCTTDSWWLLDRLRRLGFQVWWPSWVMCSVPLPGLDRYLPTRPPRLL